MIRIIYSIFFIFICISCSWGEVRKVLPEEGGQKSAEANVYYIATVTEKSVVELAVVINELAIKHPGIKKINLFINSPGGDVGAGQIGYWSIKTQKFQFRRSISSK